MIIAIANQKGGVAKTTSCFNIGLELGSRGKKVLLVDLDAQASLTICAGLEPLEYENNIVSVFNGRTEVAECVVKIRDNVDLLTSDIGLASQEMALVTRTMRELVLSKALKKVTDRYDYILIDCPPQLSILTVNAFSACDKVIIPCKTDYLAYRGVEYLIDTIQDIKTEVNPNLEIMGIIATLYEKRVKDDREVLEGLSGMGEIIGVVKKLSIAKKAVYDGVSIAERDSENDIAKAYKEICDKIERWK